MIDMLIPEGESGPQRSHVPSTEITGSVFTGSADAVDMNRTVRPSPSIAANAPNRLTQLFCDCCVLCFIFASSAVVT